MEMLHTATLIHSDEFSSMTCLPMHPNRNRIAWDLISHYAQSIGYLADGTAAIRLVDPVAPMDRSTTHDIMRLLLDFHDHEYVDYVRRRAQNGVLDEQRSLKRPRDDHALPPSSAFGSSLHSRDLLQTPEDAEFGLSNECHPYRGMFASAVAIVRGTVCAVRTLTTRSVQASHEGESSEASSSSSMGNSMGNGDPTASPITTIVNWCALHWWGGRHHAKCDRASGFCFFNDVVIGTQVLQRQLRAAHYGGRVLVLDIDAHHGDGTQDAFYHDPTVFTFSVHRFGVGVFPGSGWRDETGKGFGKGSCCNIPLPEGCTGAAAMPTILSELRNVWASFKPDGVVVVCGADALVGDPLGGLNFDVGDMQAIVRCVVEHCWAMLPTQKEEECCSPIPLVILGAGGYVDTSFARLSAAVTNDISQWTSTRSWGALPLLSSTQVHPGDDDAPGAVFFHVPEACEFFSLYGPSFCVGGLPSALFRKVTSCAMEQSEKVEIASPHSLDNSSEEHDDDDDDAASCWEHNNDRDSF